MKSGPMALRLGRTRHTMVGSRAAKSQDGANRIKNRSQFGLRLQPTP